MSPTLAPVGDEFLDRAGLVLKATADLPHSVEQVWGIITGDGASPVGPLLTATWRTPQPRTAGAVRVIRILGLLRIVEEFYRLEGPHRATFRVSRTNIPLVSGWVEDLTVERLDTGGSRVSLTMALDNWLLRRVSVPTWLRPGLTAVGEKMIRSITKAVPAPDRR